MTNDYTCEGCGVTVEGEAKFIGEDPVCVNCFDKEMARQQEESSTLPDTMLDPDAPEAEEEEVEIPEASLEELTEELRYALIYIQEVLPQVYGQDFVYGLKPNVKANHIEVTVQSMFIRSVNLRFAVPPKAEALTNLRRVLVQVANQLYTNEEQATKKLLVAEKKLVVPGR